VRHQHVPLRRFSRASVVLFLASSPVPRDYISIFRDSSEVYRAKRQDRKRERERERERDENLRSRVPYSREISGNSRLLTALSKNISDRKRRVCRALYFPREGIISPSICRATGSCQLRSVRNSGSPEVGVNFTDVDNML
jgi:hypothetical protein